MVQAIILEEHTLYRLGMKSTLEKTSDIHVAGEAYCETSLFELLDQMPVDIVLLGVNIPDHTDCVRIAKRLRCDYPAIKIISLVDEDNAQAIQSIMDVGIDGYLSKREANGKALAKMIREVAAGGEKKRIIF